jgi:serine/threonine protein kinase
MQELSVSSSDSKQSVQVPSKLDGEAMPWEQQGWQARFRELRERGQGGYGRVILAEDKLTGDVVALKHPLANEGRFRREIEEQQRSKHAHVMPILDHGIDLDWFTMPVATSSLCEAAPELSSDEQIETVRAVALGLGHAHALGIVHRDVTPNNILRVDSPTRWVVADFGLVRRPRGRTTQVRTRSGFMGTEGFIAPETIGLAHQATHLADIYSLGRTIAWMVSGVWPEGIGALLVEGPWGPLVARMTERDARDRCPEMRVVVDALVDVDRELRRHRRERWHHQSHLHALTPLEEAVAVALLESTEEDESGRPASTFWSISRTIQGFTDGGIQIGVRRLMARNLIEKTHLDTNDGPARAYALSDLGWAWVTENESRLPIRTQPRVPAPSDDDIPF